MPPTPKERFDAAVETFVAMKQAYRAAAANTGRIMEQIGATRRRRAHSSDALADRESGRRADDLRAEACRLWLLAAQAEELAGRQYRIADGSG